MGFIAALLFIKQLILCHGGTVVVQALIKPRQRKPCIQILRGKLHISFKLFRGLPAVPCFKGQLRFEKHSLKGSLVQFQRPVKKLPCPVRVSAHHIDRCRFQTEPRERFLFQSLAELQDLFQIVRRFLILFFRYGKIGQQVVCIGGALRLRFLILYFFTG